jgi:excisionase family DNA binding protein
MPEEPLVPSMRHAVELLAYSPQQAAEALGTTRQTIYNLIRRGELRRFKIASLTRIPAADVHALVGYEPPAGDA